MSAKAATEDTEDTESTEKDKRVLDFSVSSVLSVAAFWSVKDYRKLLNCTGTPGGLALTCAITA